MAPGNMNPFNNTMNNLNTNALMTMLNGAFPQSKPTAAGFKSVYIGLGMLPISILDMASLSSKYWQMSTCFDSLAKVMRGHIDTVSILELVTAVSTEIPINSTTTYVEASDMKKLIIDGVSCVTNLHGIAFINSTGGTTKAPASLKKTGLKIWHLLGWDALLMGLVSTVGFSRIRFPFLSALSCHSHILIPPPILSLFLIQQEGIHR